MAKPRAISTTPSGSTVCPMATSRSTSTSPTSATTSAPARPSIWKRSSAAPASTSPTAPCPCCPTSSPPASARWCRRRTAWCSPRSWKSIIAAKSWRQEFTSGVIRSAERMTYTNVHLLLEDDAAQRERYAPLVDRFELMQELALVLNQQARAPRLHRFRPARAADRVRRARRHDRRHPRPAQHRQPHHRGVHAGRQRERGLAPGGTPASPASTAFTKCPTPSASWNSKRSPPTSALPRNRRDPRQTLRHHRPRRDGSKQRREVVIADSGMQISSRHYQKLVAKIEGKPEERILSYLMLRSLRQARYSTENVGHFALAAAHLHALHLAHPPLSRPHGAPPAARRAHRQAHARRGPPQAPGRRMLAIRTPRRRGRTRAGRMEEGQIHDRPRRRRLRRR